MESDLSSFVSAQKSSYHRHSLFVTPFKDSSIAHAIPISHGRAVSVATVAHTNVDHSIVHHATNGSNESHTNSPPIGVFPRYSAMPRADDTPESNKEFPCRHICGCKRRGSDKTLLSEPRMCSSRGSRYDHEGNSSLHPYCTQTCPANKFLKLLSDNHHQVHHQQSHSLTVPPSTSRPVSPVSPASVPRSPMYYSPIIAPPASMEQYYTPYPMQIAMPAVTASTDLSATISGYPSFNKPSIKADGCWMPSVSSVPFTVSMVPPYQHSPPMPINRLVHPFIDNNKLQLPINDFSRPSLSPLTSPSSSPPITPRSAADHHEIVDEEDHNPSSMDGYEKKKSGREMMKTNEDGSFDADQLVKIVEDSKKTKQADMEKSFTPSIYDNPIRPSSFRRSPRPSLSMIRRNTMIASSPAALSLDPSPSSSSSNSSSSSSPSPLSRKRSSDNDHHNVIAIASKRRSMTRSHDFSYSMRRSSSTISTTSDRHDDNECDNALSFLAEAVSLLQ